MVVNSVGDLQVVGVGGSGIRIENGGVGIGINNGAGEGKIDVVSSGDITLQCVFSTGIRVSNNGDYDVSVSSLGNLNAESTFSRGIEIFSAGVGSVSVDVAGSIKSSARAIGISESGDGEVVVNVDADVSQLNTFASAISVFESGAGGVDLNLAGTLTTSVSSTGSSADGVLVFSFDEGDININSSSRISTSGRSAVAITGFSDGAGNLSIKSTGDIETQGNLSRGIIAIAPRQGDISITAGNISTTGNDADAIATSVQAGFFSVDGGFIDVTVEGDVTASGVDADGIVVESAGTNGSRVKIDGGSVQGGLGNAAGVSFDDAQRFSQNLVENDGSITALSGMAVLGGAGSETVSSSGNILGDIFLGESADRVELKSGSAFAGNIDLGLGNDAFLIEGDLDFQGSINGGEGFDVMTTYIAQGRSLAFDLGSLTGFEALQKRGDGALALEGATTTDQPVELIVQEGSAAVNSSNAVFNAVVATGATLVAGGKLRSLTNSGDLGLGSELVGDIASTTVSENLVLQSDGALFVDIDNVGNADLLNVNGTVSVDGTLSINGIGDPRSYVLSDQYTIISAAGGVSGVFSTVEDNLPDVDVEANYTSSAVEISYTGAAETSDKSILANAVQGSSRSGALFTRNVLDQAMLVAMPGSQNVELETTQSFASSFSDLSVGTPTYTAWAGVFGGSITVDPSPGATGYNAGIAGLVFGGGGNFETDTGAAVTTGLVFGRSSNNVDSGLSSAIVDTWHIGVYGGVASGPLIAGVAFSYNFEDYGFSRTIPLAGGPLVASGESRGNTFAVSMAASYDLAPSLGLSEANGFRLAPILRFDYARSDLDLYSETGAGILNLVVNSDSYHRSRAGLGVQISAVFDTPENLVIRPELELRYDHSFGDEQLQVNSFIPGVTNANFTNFGTLEAENRFAVGAGVSIEFNDTVSAKLRYDGTFSSRSESHQAGAEFVFRF